MYVLVWSVPGVNTHVLFEGRSLHGRIGTFITLEILHALMNFLVKVQLVLPREVPWAMRTFERFVPYKT